MIGVGRMIGSVDYFGAVGKPEELNMRKPSVGRVRRHDSR